MASRPYGIVMQQIQLLFQRGSLAGLSEWQLLDRYVSRRDESAFEALVARHGPMVLGVCRRVLDDPHAVEDAFQATFLVLVRKAGTLGPHDAIGHWLYGVACRVALRARCEVARRRSLEVPVERIEGVGRGDEPSDDELAPILDEELGRLPSKYRAPVVLCFLQGLTHEEAARQLRWPIGSVKGRLARARELLRGRLIRRGLLPSAGLLAATLGRNASAAVPESLRQATVQAALQISAGRATAGVVSVSVVRMMEGVLSAMFVTQVKLAATILGTCGCLALGAWALGLPAPGSKAGSNLARAETRESGNVPPTRAEAAELEAKEQALRDTLEKPIALKLRGDRLEDVLKSIKRTTQAAGDPGVPIYVDPEGLHEAGATLDSPVTIDAQDAPLKTALDQALRPLRLAATTRDGLLVVSSRQEVALIELRTLNEQLRRMTRRPEGATEPGGPHEASPAAWLKRMQSHRITYSADYDDAADPEDEAKTRAILAALKKRVVMSFLSETPLEDVLKYIKSATKGRELPEGIPIYVDPVGLQEAEKTMSSPVTLDLEGVALRETLRLVLKQLGLLYSVKDGLLTITSQSSEDTWTPILTLAEKATRGELSLREMNDLIELFKTRQKVMRYAHGEPNKQEEGGFQ
jgi:RNA polymerase sigma factor (sigma-70 family)